MKVFLSTFMLPMISGFTIRSSGLSSPHHQLPTVRQHMISPNDSSNGPDNYDRQQTRETTVDKAYDDLMKEISNKSNYDDRINTKSKEWVDRSFDFLSELNRDTAKSSRVESKNQEMLNKQKKWINNIIDFATEVKQDIDSMTPPKDDNVKKISSVGSTSQGFWRQDSLESPRYYIRDMENWFQIEMELPGVEKSDIDLYITDNGKTLVVSGERSNVFGSGGGGSSSSSSSTEPGIKFLQQFELDDNIVQDKINAKMKNGILLVTVPKKVRTNNDEAKLRIPVQTE